MLSKLRTALPADASPRNTSTKTSLGLAVALGTLCAAWPGVGAAQVQATGKTLSPVIETKEGPVQGFVSNGVIKFLGIPYAEPPVGDLRWRPPKDRGPWTTVRNATEFRPDLRLRHDARRVLRPAEQQ